MRKRKILYIKNFRKYIQFFVFFSYWVKKIVTPSWRATITANGSCRRLQSSSVLGSIGVVLTLAKLIFILYDQRCRILNLSTKDSTMINGVFFCFWSNEISVRCLRTMCGNSRKTTLLTRGWGEGGTSIKRHPSWNPCNSISDQNGQNWYPISDHNV